MKLGFANDIGKRILWLSFACLQLIQANEIRSDEPVGQLAASARKLIKEKCWACHKDFLESEEPLAGHAIAGKANESYAMELILSSDPTKRMPKNSEPLSGFEAEILRNWIDSGAQQPGPDQTILAAVKDRSGKEYVLEQMAKYLRAVSDEDRQFIRFFSCHHNLIASSTVEDLELQRQALAKGMNHLSWKNSTIQPVAVDPNPSTIFAVDLRDLGWNDLPFVEESAGGSEQPSQLNLFDLILLEYPYATMFQNSPADRRLWELWGDRGPINHISYVRIDWFISHALQPPLYEDILGLPRSLDELESDFDLDIDRNVAAGKAKRAGMAVSGVSRNNRVVEWHSVNQRGRDFSFWGSTDYGTSRGQDSIFREPVDLKPGGGEFIVTLPNDLQFYFIADAVGNRIDEAPTSIVTDRFAQDKIVRNGLACMRCHASGMQRFTDDVRSVLLTLPDTTHIDTALGLELYAPADAMSKIVERDSLRFMGAVKKALGAEQTVEPLTPVSQLFLDGPINIEVAASELGQPSGGSIPLVQIFRLPQFSKLGLGPLATDTGISQVIRRDLWEDSFDQVVSALGLGIPILPLDGISQPDFLGAVDADEIILRTNKLANIFSPGDDFEIHVDNKSDAPQYIELLGISSSGRIARIGSPPIVLLSPGESLNLTGDKIRPELGRERVVMFSSPVPFKPAMILRGRNHGDRYVHSYFAEGSSAKDALQVVKKTLLIETR